MDTAFSAIIDEVSRTTRVDLCEFVDELLLRYPVPAPVAADIRACAEECKSIRDIWRTDMFLRLLRNSVAKT